MKHFKEEEGDRKAMCEAVERSVGYSISILNGMPLFFNQNGEEEEDAGYSGLWR